MPMPRENIARLLNPRSIAIIGASSVSSGHGTRVLRFLQRFGFKGPVFPVNPKYDYLEGLRCYGSIEELPETPDAAVISIPAIGVEKAIRDCIQHGVGGAVVFTAGFSETRLEEGMQLERQLAELCKGASFPLCGPNTGGVMNFVTNAFLAFSSSLEEFKRFVTGPVGFVTQSGAVGSNIMAEAQRLGLGFSHMIGTGNQAVLEIFDYVDYLLDQPDINVIGGYIEGVRSADKLIESAQLAIEAEKPLVILKSGRSQKGAKAVVSHTGSMAGEDKVYDTVFREYGIIRVSNIEDMIDTLTAFAGRYRPACGKVGLITVSGGFGVLATDSCEDFGLELAEYEDKTTSALIDLLPVYGSAANPIDVSGNLYNQPHLFRDALRLMAQDCNTDIIVILLVSLRSLSEAIVDTITAVANESPKPIFVSWLGGPKEAISRLKDFGIPVYNEPARCLRAVGRFSYYRRYLNSSLHQNRSLFGSSPLNQEEILTSRTINRDIVAEYRVNYPERIWNEAVSRELLSQYGIPFATGFTVDSEKEAIACAQKIGGSVVIKTAAEGITHKSDIGGVICNVAGDATVASAYRQITNSVKSRMVNKWQRVQIQEYVASGTEVIIGAKLDPQFGWVIMIGSGGIWTEVLKDTVCALAPLTSERAQAMIEEMRLFPVLSGKVRNSPADIEAVRRVLLAVSDFLDEASREGLQELDINPLVVLGRGQGAKAVDSLLVWR